MKQARYKEPLPLAVIEAARAGDAGALSLKCLRVLKLMVCPKYSRFFKMFTMQILPERYAYSEISGTSILI